MSTDNQTNKTPIIVALIGLMGVLGAALIANWDKIGRWGPSSQQNQNSQPPQSVIPDKKSTVVPSKSDGSANVSAELVRRSVTPRADKSAAPVDTLPSGRVRHLYSVWIEAPPDILNMIDKVMYRYDHPQFDTPRTESTNRSNGFRDSYNGIGAVDADMDIIMVLRDGEQVTLKFNMYKAIFGK